MMEEPLSKGSLRVPQNEMMLYEDRREDEDWVRVNLMLWQDSIWREEEDEVEENQGIEGKWQFKTMTGGNDAMHREPSKNGTFSNHLDA